MTSKPDCAWNLTDLADVPQNGITVMSTFACGGGSSMGYKRAGCSIVAANDIDPEMAWHYKHNLHPQLYYLCPIRDLLTAQLPPDLFAPSTFSHKKLHDKRLSNGPTAADDTFKHWSECRHLTYREWKRLGAYPDDYHAKTDKIGKYMIGMSVPPKMTEQVSRAVIDQWLIPNGP